MQILKVAVAFLASLPLIAGSCGDSDSDPGLFLSVSATNPSDGETGVFLDQTIAISFDQALAPASFDEGDISVEVGGEAVPTIINSNAGTITVFAPQMETGTVYSVTVDQSIQGADGSQLAEDYVFGFTTGETYADGSQPAKNLKPFGRGRFTALVERSEYMLFGLDTANNVQLVDPLDYNTPPTVGGEVLFEESNVQAVTDRQKRATDASLDDDFHTEALVVSWPAVGIGSLSLFDTGEAGTTSEVLSVDLSIRGEANAAYLYDVSAGDVDGDGLDEVLVAGVVAGAQASERLGSVWIFDDAEGGFAPLHKIDLEGEFDPGSGFLGLDRIRIVKANVDADSASEIAVAYHMNGSDHLSILVIDDAESGYAEIHNSVIVGTRLVIPDTSTVVRQIDVAAGDADRDGVEELLVAWQSYDRPGDTCRDGFWLLDDMDESFALLGESEVLCSNRDAPTNYASDSYMADLNGDRQDELIVWGFVFGYTVETSAPEIILLDDTPRLCNDEPSLSTYLGDVSAYAVADVNGDFREDLILLKGDSSVEVRGCVEHPHYNPDTGELESLTNHFETIDIRAPFPSSFDLGAVMVPVNVDHDSVVVRYGAEAPDPTQPLPSPGEPQPTLYQEHTVYFADNRLIAAIAAPPCADGIGQNTDACSAGFGTSIGGSISVGVTISQRAGILMGIEEEVQAGFVFATITVQKAEAEITAQVEASVSISSTTGVSREITDVAVFGEDLIVFHTTPYDRYTFGVVSHPDGDVLGKLVTVDVPQRSKILAVTREYYNANNGDQLDVGANIFAHRPGELASYPSYSEVVTHMLPPNLPLALVGPVTVNQGSGSKQLTGEITSEGTVGAELTLSVDSMAKICGATVCGGVTSGFSIGASSEVSLSSSAIFSSEVGALDAEHFAADQYDFGLFAYVQPLLDPFGKTMQMFVVVNHWVE